MTAARDINFDIRGRDRTQAAFDSAKANARGFQGALDTVQRGFNLAAVAAKAFVAGFAIEGVRRLGDTVADVVKQAADLVDTADKLSWSTDDLQALLFGMEQAGVEAGEVEAALTQWSKRIGEAHSQGGRLADILKANNVALTDGNGNLRASVDLMRDYAELIKNAGSDQERMDLINQGFGRSAAAMINAFRDGRAGIDEIMDAARDAGVVIDEELLRKAAEIDDEFNLMWTRFEVRAKEAILSAVGWLDNLRDAAADALSAHDRAVRAAELGDFVGSLAGESGPAQKSTQKGDRIARYDAANFNARFEGVQRTVIPGDDDEPKRRKAAGAAREQESAYERVAQALEHERRLIGLSEIEQRILNEQRRAGVDATSAQGQAIAATVTQIEAEIAAQERLEEQQERLLDSMDYLAEAGFDSLWAVATGAETAEEAVKKLGLELARAAAEALLFNKGPLAGLFGGGGGGGGLLGSIFTAIFGGFRAGGGPVDPWKSYVVGENGPELLRMGPQGGHVTSNDTAFGGGGGIADVRVFVDQDGNWQAAVERIAAGPAARAAGKVARVMPAVIAAENANGWRNLRPTGLS